VYRLAALADVETRWLETRFGAPSGPLRVGRLGDVAVAFLARHGEATRSRRTRSIPRQPGRAAAGRRQRVLALNTVGGITERFGPRVLACPDQMIDYTWGRVPRSATNCPMAAPETTWCTDFGHPYTPLLRSKVLARRAWPAWCWMTAAATAPPRATAGNHRRDRATASRRLRPGRHDRHAGRLARELGLDYACLAIVANWAAGCGDGEEITMAEVLDNVAAASAGLPELVGELARG
jgi:5'-methylthioinosine phosphorylase